MYPMTNITIIMNVKATTRVNDATPEQYVNSAKTIRVSALTMIGLLDRMKKSQKVAQRDQRMCERES